MSGSPFHGIFSTNRWQGGSGKGLFSFGGQQRADLPTEAQREESGKQREESGKLAVDIYDQDGYTIVRAPIAGVRMSDIDIEVNENVLTIQGTRKLPDNVPTDQYYLRECFWGPFSRTITLPDPVDPRKIRATFGKDCILKILIPKEERVKTVKILEG